MSDAPLFRFADVVVSFGTTVVLDHVTLDVGARGQICCLLGPSGAGKSTLLRLCNRLEVPTSGTVSLRGQDLDSVDPLLLRRRVGMVFQRPTMFPGTVRDNLLVADPDATTNDLNGALDRANLGAAILDKQGSVLSGGEAQRACLARTLLTQPQVLLLDEPTSALDPTATKALEGLGRSLADDGMPLLWVTHDLDQAERIADRKVVLVGGRVADDHQTDHYQTAEEALHHHHADDVTHDGHAHDTATSESQESTDGPG